MTWFNFILNRAEPVAQNIFLTVGDLQIPVAVIRNPPPA
jgi:hypothetical protein